MIPDKLVGVVTVDPADLRANIAYVSQDPGLFRGTVRENITLARPNATDGEVMRASKLAGVHEFIGQHPEGYDALIGDNGEGFSGGQRQAIAMARAFIMNPSIMVCDEPTNAMDTESEAHLIAALRQQVQNKTFVLVTHRAQMLQLVDRVLLMHKGRLLADGPRDKVLEFVAKGGTRDAATEINSRQPDTDQKDADNKDKDKDGA
ncbi:MAG: ATP-binding cassette domain-containing protein [Pseudomonadota bacterium]